MIYPGGPAGTTGESVDTTYNELGYATTLTSSNNNTTLVNSSGYTAQGSLASQTLGGAIARTLTYDPSTQRLTNMKAGVGGSATNRQNLSYAYDAVDNVKSIVDGNNSNQRQCFHYDDRNRLDHAYTGTGGTGGCSSVDNTTGSNPPPYNQTFQYTPSGNFVTAAGRSYGYDATHPHAPKTVDADSFTYNENGAETGRVVGGVGALLGYDQLNHLTSVAQTSGTSTYVYGTDDQRLIRKDGNTVTLYLEGSYQARSVNGAAATVTKYYSLGSQRVAVRKGSTLYYELADHLGSASVTTDSSGNNMTRQNYYPFGALRPGPGNNLPVDETYLGKTLDTATNLVQMGARYYDPAVGRFTSADPLAHPDNPQTLNPYTYSVNDPATLKDPTGLDAPGSSLEGVGIYCGAHPEVCGGVPYTPPAVPLSSDQIQNAAHVRPAIHRALQRCAQGDAGGCGRAVVLYNGASNSQSNRFERKLCKRIICGDLGWAIPDEGTTNLVAGAIGILAVAPAAFALASGGGVLEATGLTAVEGQRIVDEVAATESKSSGLVARAVSKFADETGAIRFGRAPEFAGGELTEDQAMSAAEKWLGEGYSEVSPGRFVSEDSERIVRYGQHEVGGAYHHIHFEAAENGPVVENISVEIMP